jgi:hypothetical protein
MAAWTRELQPARRSQRPARVQEPADGVTPGRHHRGHFCRRVGWTSQLASLSDSSISCLARWNDTPSAFPTSRNGNP